MQRNHTGPAAPTSPRFRLSLSLSFSLSTRRAERSRGHRRGVSFLQAWLQRGGQATDVPTPSKTRLEWAAQFSGPLFSAILTMALAALTRTSSWAWPIADSNNANIFSAMVTNRSVRLADRPANDYRSPVGNEACRVPANPRAAVSRCRQNERVTRCSVSPLSVSTLSISYCGPTKSHGSLTRFTRSRLCALWDCQRH